MQQFTILFLASCSQRVGNNFVGRNNQFEKFCDTTKSWFKYKALNRWESIDPEMVNNFMEATDPRFTTNSKESDPEIINILKEVVDSPFIKAKYIQ